MTEVGMMSHYPRTPHLQTAVNEDMDDLPLLLILQTPPQQFLKCISTVLSMNMINYTASTGNYILYSASSLHATF